MNRHPNFDNILQSLHNRYIFYVHYIFNVSVYYFLQKSGPPTGPKKWGGQTLMRS